MCWLATANGSATFNHLDTMIAMVEASEGVAIITSLALPACRSRKVDDEQIDSSGGACGLLPRQTSQEKARAGADDFTFFLQGYIARWAGRAGIL